MISAVAVARRGIAHSCQSALYGTVAQFGRASVISDGAPSLITECRWFKSILSLQQLRGSQRWVAATKERGAEVKKYVEVQTAKEFALGFFSDPILRMAVNQLLDNAPSVEIVPERTWLPTCHHPEDGTVVIVTDGYAVDTALYDEADDVFATEHGFVDPNEVTRWKYLTDLREVV